MIALFWFYLKFLAQSTSYSCINLSDKITVYDGKTASDKTSIIDVYCSEKMNKKITSSGPNLLIEFELSSNRTSNGFSAKYRFTEAQSRYYFVTSFIIPYYLFLYVVIDWKLLSLWLHTCMLFELTYECFFDYSFRFR